MLYSYFNQILSDALLTAVPLQKLRHRSNLSKFLRKVGSIVSSSRQKSCWPCAK